MRGWGVIVLGVLAALLLAVAASRADDPPPTVPGAATLDSATPANGAVALAWTAPASDGGAPITGYKVYRGTSAGGETLLAPVGAVTAYTDTTAANGTAYFYEVTALNAVGEGAFSNERSATPATVPDAPTLDSATAGNGTVALAWTPPSADGGAAITGYAVYRGTSTGNETLLATPGLATAYTDMTAENGTTYFYEVVALNQAGEGLRSNERSATPRTVPDAPELAVPDPGDATVSLSWTPPDSDGGSPITGYSVYRGTGGGAKTLLTTLGDVTGYTDGSVVNGTTYTYEVAAVNAAGEGPHSADRSATPRTVPGAPTLNTPSNGVGSVALSWTAPAFDGGSPVTGYTVHRRASGVETVFTVAPDSLAYTDTTGTPGTTYAYSVAAVNVAGEGPASSELSGTPLGVPAAPTLDNAVPGDTSVTLEWSAPASDGGAALTGYMLYRAVGSGGSLVFLETLGPAATTYTDTGLTNGTAYRYTVSAVNSVGESAQSNERGATPATVPGAPALDSATADVGSVALAWSAPGSNGGAAITNYRIYRGTASGGETLLTTVGNVLTYTDSTAANGTTYFYEVSAVNSAGEGAQSNERSATTPTAPSAPSLDSATPGNGTVALAWTAPASDGGSAITAYRVYRGSGGAEKTLRAALGGDARAFVDDTAVNGTEYAYVVTAVNGVGEGPASSELSATPATVPDPPTLDSATAGFQKVDLSWTAPSGNGGAEINAYRLYRGTSSGSETFLVDVPLGTTYTDTNVVSGTTYFYEVAAVNRAGAGAPSGERSAKPYTTPGAPTLAEPVPGDETVFLSWAPPASDGGAPITNYKLYRATGAGAMTLVATLDAVTTFTDTGRANGTSYAYEVSAVNAAGEGPHSAPPKTAIPRTVPTKPTLNGPSNGAGFVTLTWSAPGFDGGSPITGYRIHRSANGVETVFNRPATPLTYTDTSGTPGTTYTYDVSAVNAAGEGPRSTALPGTPLGPPTAPTLDSATPGNTTVALGWSPPASNGGLDLTGYNLYRRVGSGSLLLYKTLPPGTTTYTDTGLANGTAYGYVVSAKNSLGEGALSGQRTATPATLPDAPVLNSATAGIGSVALAWSAPASNGGAQITSYRIYRGTASGGESLLTTVGNVLTYTDSTAAAGTTYFYEVAAVNSAGEGAASNERSATTPSVPSAPTLVSATAGVDSVVLVWSPPATDGGRAVTGYKVYRGTSSGTGTLVASLGNVTTYTDSNRADGKTYFYRVTAINAVGESPASNERSAFVPILPGAPILDATVAGNASIALRWTPPASNGGVAITAYKVYRVPTAGGSESLLATTGPVPEYTDNSAPNGVLFTYRVSAVNLVGEGPKSGTQTAIATPISFGRPGWWDGPCDSVAWNQKAAAAGWTGAGAHELGASYLGIPVCGPRPGADAAPGVAWGHSLLNVPEWDSTELAFRFMAQVYGVQAYSATAENVVRNYTDASGGGLVKLLNGTAGAAPVPGDVISFDHQTNNGNVAVVVSSSVDGNGNGSITMLSQNDTTDGWRTVPVTAWTVRGFSQNTAYGWLHDPTARTSGHTATGRAELEPPLPTGPRPDTPSFTLPPGTQRPPRP